MGGKYPRKFVGKRCRESIHPAAARACPHPGRLISSSGVPRDAAQGDEPHTRESHAALTGTGSGSEKGTLCLMCLIRGRIVQGVKVVNSASPHPKPLHAAGNCSRLMPRPGAQTFREDLEQIWGREGGGSTGTAHMTLK